LHPAYYFLAVWNLVVFALYGIDKWRSTRSQWRVSERTLILSAFFMGASGAMLGMYFFRHKTRQMKFILLLPLALLVNVAAVLAVFYLSAAV